MVDRSNAKAWKKKYLKAYPTPEQIAAVARTPKHAVAEYLFEAKYTDYQARRPVHAATRPSLVTASGFLLTATALILNSDSSEGLRNLRETGSSLLLFFVLALILMLMVDAWILDRRLVNVTGWIDLYQTRLDGKLEPQPMPPVPFPQPH